MTYRQPPVCRDSSCGRPAVDNQDSLVEGDRRLCEQHLAEVRQARAGLLARQPVPAGRPASPRAG